MSHYIPLEFQIQILKSLPVISLMRFRSVSKQWKSLIDSPEFIADHSVHSRHTLQGQHLLVQYRDQLNYKRKYVSIVDDDDDDSFPQQKFPLTVPRSIKNLLEDDSDDDDDDDVAADDYDDDYVRYAGDDDETYGDDLRVCGSSHGLFCFFSYSMAGTAVIWNPSIRKSVSVRLPNVKKSYAVGFGVCPNTLDPKIVMVKEIERPRRSYGQMEIMSTSTRFDFLSKNWQVKIFTLSSGTWRSPFSNNQLDKWIRFVCPNSRVVVDGFIYWFASWYIPGGNGNPMILSFNLTSEEFNEIRFPGKLFFQRNIDLSVHKIRESLGVLQCKRKADKQVIKVWMLENCESESYTKLFTISLPHASVRTIAGIRKTGQLIMETRDNDGDEDSAILAVYDPTPPHIKNLGIYGSPGSLFVSSYTESLLLLDHKGALGNNEDDGHVARCRDTQEHGLEHECKEKQNSQVENGGKKKARVVY